MNSKSNFTKHSCRNFSLFLAALALALIVPARAETPPAAIPFADIGARATAGYQGDALSVTTTADGARLRCGFQRLAAVATPEGLWLESTGPGAAGKFRVVATTLGRVGNSTADAQPSTTLPATGTISVKDKLVRFTRPGLTEEYSVSVDGVRQDFVIAAPPAGTGRGFEQEETEATEDFVVAVPPAGVGDLRVELALSGARAEAAAGGVRLRLEGSGRKLVYSRLRVEDATGRELTARLEVFSAGRLAVSVADANATYPVRVDPTFSDADWVSLGSGMSYPGFVVVNAVAISGTNLYAGGQFTTAGGVPANNIAKWDGSAWLALGSGKDNDVYALAVSGTNIYAGGDFYKGIAKWNGSAWSALGSGMDNQVNALAVSGMSLYAGGPFTTAGGLTVNGIAKWDGSAWSALGSGMIHPGTDFGYVVALAVSGTNLYAGGWFTNAGGVMANYIAKWDGNAWSTLGSGMNGMVFALAVSGTDLYAGGSFTTAGGVPANSIAKWDGGTWSALGSGMNSTVSALAVSGTDLYAGGAFVTAGEVPANHIAKWDGSAWSALGSGMSGGTGWVAGLAADGVGHLFIGGDFSTAGTTVSPAIAEANLPSIPTILASPQSQTAEIGATVCLAVNATGEPPPVYEWYFNGTNILTCASCNLVLTNILGSQSGTYTVVVTNLSGSATSAPVALNVIAPVARRLVPGVNLVGQAGDFLGLDYRDNLGPTTYWETIAMVTLSNSSQFFFDVSQPLRPQRFYRAWQRGTPGVVPSLSVAGLVPAIRLTGNVGDSLHVDYIYQIGPTNAWVTLATVTLTNTSQLYFDVSAIGQPARLWRVVPVP
ncbi:exported hypothetical protein [Verrucomicrobia bacterium]|nr:exported hypothetical protein [Verrucomicrobiota bacterium]